MAALDRLIDQQSEERAYYASAVEMVESRDADLQHEETVGALDRDKINEEVRKMEEQVVVNGAPPSFREELSILLRENHDVFRTQLGPDPPAKVTPMRIHVRGVAPVRCRERRYAPEMSDCMRDMVGQLEE